MSKIDFLGPKETRYDRHSLISWWDQEKLLNARVIVVGAGALGNEVLKLLALMGVGNITVVDFDVVSFSNLSRMVLFREEDIGKPKVEIAAKRIKEINPEIKITPINDDIRFALGLGEYRDNDLIFGCLDSVNARYELNRKCMLAGVEWIDGGISDYHGQVVRYSPFTGACYECNFTDKTIERFQKRYSCPFGLVSGQNDEKIPTTAVTTSIIAAFQVQQGLLMLHGINEGINPGERLFVYMKPFRMYVDKLPYNNQCMAHHSLPEDIKKFSYSPNMSINSAIEKASEISPDIDTFVFNYEIVTEMLCPTCGNKETILRPKEKINQHLTKCPNCKEMREPIIINQLKKDTPLANLTFMHFDIPDKEIIKFIGEEDSIYIQFDSNSSKPKEE